MRGEGATEVRARLVDEVPEITSGKRELVWPRTLGTMGEEMGCRFGEGASGRLLDSFATLLAGGNGRLEKTPPSDAAVVDVTLVGRLCGAPVATDGR